MVWNFEEIMNYFDYLRMELCMFIRIKIFLKSLRRMCELREQIVCQQLCEKIIGEMEKKFTKTPLFSSDIQGIITFPWQQY